MCNAFYRRVQKSNFNNTEFAIFGDKYLSQDLIVILRNITRLCQVRQRGVGANQYIGLNKINIHPMLAYCWPIVYDHGSAVKQLWLKVSFLQGTPATQYPDTMLVQCWKSVIDVGTTFNQHWVSASRKKQ